MRYLWRHWAVPLLEDPMREKVNEMAQMIGFMKAQAYNDQPAPSHTQAFDSQPDDILLVDEWLQHTIR